MVFFYLPINVYFCCENNVTNNTKFNNMEEKSKTFIMISREDLKQWAKELILETKSNLEEAISKSKNDRLVSIDEATQILGVNRSTLWKWGKKNYLKPIEVGGKRRYLLSDIRAIMRGEN